MEEFSERFAPAIQGVVEFAKRIPGFGFLSQDDQVTLLKVNILDDSSTHCSTPFTRSKYKKCAAVDSCAYIVLVFFQAGVFEVLLVRLACMFDSQTKTLVCLNGQMLRRDALHTASNARFLLDSMFDFAERLNTLHLSDSEVGLFCAVVVIAAGRFHFLLHFPSLNNIKFHYLDDDSFILFVQMFNFFPLTFCRSSRVKKHRSGYQDANEDGRHSEEVCLRQPSGESEHLRACDEEDP